MKKLSKLIIFFLINTKSVFGLVCPTGGELTPSVNPNSPVLEIVNKDSKPIYITISDKFSDLAKSAPLLLAANNRLIGYSIYASNPLAPKLPYDIALRKRLDLSVPTFIKIQFEQTKAGFSSPIIKVETKAKIKAQRFWETQIDKSILLNFNTKNPNLLYSDNSQPTESCIATDFNVKELTNLDSAGNKTGTTEISKQTESERQAYAKQMKRREAIKTSNKNFSNLNQYPNLNAQAKTELSNLIDTGVKYRNQITDYSYIAVYLQPLLKKIGSQKDSALIKAMLSEFKQILKNSYFDEDPNELRAVAARKELQDMIAKLEKDISGVAKQQEPPIARLPSIQKETPQLERKASVGKKLDINQFHQLFRNNSLRLDLVAVRDALTPSDLNDQLHLLFHGITYDEYYKNPNLEDLKLRFNDFNKLLITLGINKVPAEFAKPYIELKKILSDPNTFKKEKIDINQFQQLIRNNRLKSELAWVRDALMPSALNSNLNILLQGIKNDYDQNHNLEDLKLRFADFRELLKKLGIKQVPALFAKPYIELKNKLSASFDIKQYPNFLAVDPTGPSFLEAYLIAKARGDKKNAAEALPYVLYHLENILLEIHKLRHGYGTKNKIANLNELISEYKKIAEIFRDELSSTDKVSLSETEKKYLNK